MVEEIRRLREFTQATARNTRYLVGLLLGLLGFVTHLATRTPSVELPVDRWEYMVKSYSDRHWNDDTLGPDLDGKRGWEIISARRATVYEGRVDYECILKRKIR